MQKHVTLAIFTILVPFLNIVAVEKVNLDSLDYYLSKESELDSVKEERIAKIKEEIKSFNYDFELQYHAYSKLYDEYSSYMYDSAYACVQNLFAISKALDDPQKMAETSIKQGFCYLSAGLFKESFDVFASLDIKKYNKETQIDYYFHKARLHYDLADYNNNEEFREKYLKDGNQILDSALILLPFESARYWSTLGLKRMKSDNDRGSLDAFRRMISSYDYSEHDLAIATSSMAFLYYLQGKTEEAKNYFTQAAIADIKSSTKETVALRNLAQILYHEGEIKHAAKYIKKASQDAAFYNARHRQLEIGNILPIIEAERMNIIEKQKERITSFLIFSSILLCLFIGAIIIIWKQLKRLDQAKQTIQKANETLTFFNNDLEEANKIKDEYIGYFFNQSSEFINKMETFQKWVRRKVMARQYDDLNSVPKNMDTHKERELLYSRFDQIFLKLFPDFVRKFNELLRPEEQIQLKKDELLNTDLRIYALIRLGINDNEKIAQFLGYSVNTIYTYKTKTKNKALVSNEEFRQQVMEIKSI